MTLDKSNEHIFRVLFTSIQVCLPQIKEKIKQYTIQSIVPTGEMIGVLCAQSIGERQTQLTLNSFHQAGLAVNTVLSGVPRFLEILNATKDPKVSINSFEMENKSYKTIADIRKKISSWLVNSPVDISNYMGETDEDSYSFSTPEALKFDDNPLNNSIWTLELEKEVRRVVSLFNNEELRLIEEKLSGIPASTSANKFDLSVRAIQRKQKELFETFSHELRQLHSPYGDDVSEGDIFDSFRNEVLYSIKV